VLDFDDTHLKSVIHPSAPVLGALVALSDERTVSGARFLHAFALGVETACRIANAVSPGHYEKGWHITGTCGAFGAAAASAKILSLDEKRMLSALGLAATQASGLVEMLGAEGKCVNAGAAARNGLAAARLAEQHVAGPARPLEGLRGFMNVFGGNHDPAALTVGLGSRWELSQVALKPYPCGVVLHAVIDACLELRKKTGVDDIHAILITLHPLAIERGDKPQPSGAFEAKLSAQHAAAVALVHGAAGVAQFTDEAAGDAGLASLRARVRLTADPAMDKAAAVVVLELRNGEKRSAHVPHARGSLERPMSDAELEAKFCELAGPGAQELIELVRSLDTLEDASRLWARS